MVVNDTEVGSFSCKAWVKTNQNALQQGEEYELAGCSLIPVRSCSTGLNWQVLPGDRRSQSKVKLALHPPLCPSCCYLIMYIILLLSLCITCLTFFKCDEMWQLHWTEQLRTINISYYCQATTWGCSRRLPSSPYSDWLLYFLQRSTSFIRKGMDYSRSELLRSWCLADIWPTEVQ
jgi:hypothetical protein